MNKPSLGACSILVLGALSATLAGSSCTAEDETGNLERVELRGGYDDGGYDDGGYDDGGDDECDDDGHHEECEIETQDVVLWPPNHELVEIDVLDDCIEEMHHCEDCEVKIEWVTSDEAVDAPGSGNTDPDIVCVDDDTVEVRRERSGQGDGRVYRIGFTLECDHHDHHDDGDYDHDDHEHEVYVCEVSVPHDQGQGNEAVDSGPEYTVECS